MDGYGWLWIKMKNPGEWAHVQGCFRIFRRNVESNKFFFYKQVVAICLSFPGCAILLQVWGGFASLWNLATLDRKRTEYSIWNSGSARKQIWSVWTTPKSADLPTHFGLVCYARTYDLVGNIRNPRLFDCRKLHQGLSSLSWIRPLHSRAAQAIWRSHSKYIRVSIDFLGQCQALSSSMHSFQTQLQHFVPFGFLWL